MLVKVEYEQQVEHTSKLNIHHPEIQPDIMRTAPPISFKTSIRFRIPGAVSLSWPSIPRAITIRVIALAKTTPHVSASPSSCTRRHFPVATPLTACFVLRCSRDFCANSSRWLYCSRYRAPLCSRYSAPLFSITNHALNPD